MTVERILADVLMLALIALVGAITWALFIPSPGQKTPRLWERIIWAALVVTPLIGGFLTSRTP